jgi:hypothetical protein
VGRREEGKDRFPRVKGVTNSADKRASGSKKAARKKGQLKNLARSSQEVSARQAKAVKGGSLCGEGKRVKID